MCFCAYFYIQKGLMIWVQKCPKQHIYYVTIKHKSQDTCEMYLVPFLFSFRGFNGSITPTTVRNTCIFKAFELLCIHNRIEVELWNILLPRMLPQSGASPLHVLLYWQARVVSRAPDVLAEAGLFLPMPPSRRRARLTVPELTGMTKTVFSSLYITFARTGAVLISSSYPGSSEAF